MVFHHLLHQTRRKRGTEISLGDGEWIAKAILGTLSALMLTRLRPAIFAKVNMTRVVSKESMDGLLGSKHHQV